MHDDGECLILVLIGCCTSSFVKCLFKSFAHFVNWVICPLVGFFGPILDRSSFSGICIVNIFSQSVDSLFIFLTVSLNEQLILILIMSNLFINTFFYGDYCMSLRNFCLPQSCKDFLLCFLLIFTFVFKSMTCFKLFSCVWCEVRVMVQFSLVWIASCFSTVH